jgi:hypothetical protein
MAKADPVVAKADPVVKAGPVTDLTRVKAAQARVGVEKVAVMRPRVRTSGKPCSRNLIRMVTANSMKMNALPVKKCRSFSAHNLEADKAAGLALVKVAQVKAGQALVNPDRVGRVRAVDLAAEVKVDAAALVDAAASGLPIL